MNKNLVWKMGLIIFLVVFAFFWVWPPQDKIKAGLDIAGGTSLIYDIDTTGLSREESKGLAQRMIPILLRRVDPTSVANIVMRPHGNRRIEIQLPFASAEAINKRKFFRDAFDELENKNVNLLIIKRALFADNQERQKVFDTFAGDSEERKLILENLVKTFDEKNKKAEQRDGLREELKESQDKIESAGLNGDVVEMMAPEWSKVVGKGRSEAITKYLEESVQVDPDNLEDNIKLVKNYVATYMKWARVVNDLAEPETGKRAQYNQAIRKLSDLNLNMEELEVKLNLPANSSQRRDELEKFKQRFPDRLVEIDAIVQVFAEYRDVRGRLDDPEDLKRMLKGSGVLEFRIVPTSGDGKSNPDELSGYLEGLQTKGPKLASDSRYVWCEIEKPDVFPRGWQEVGEPVIGSFAEKEYVLTSNQRNECMIRGEKKWKLTKAYPTTDPDTGRRVIGFNNDEVAARLFYDVTRNNINRPLCVLLDNVAISAPTINDTIRSSGIIKGEYTQTEIDDMVNKLNAGSFPARLSDVPVSEKSIGSLIGADNRDKGIRAGLIGLAAVLTFMLIYYIGSGAIANIALLMNILFVLAMMVILDATFTLPGIAGLILTIGMSVDANVLIFERIREEQDRGSSLRMAIANGYQRAFRTIFDANITTFITALILYLVASEEIKGFAIVLMLGIASSMFTALFVTRLIFDFLVGKKIIRDHLVMLRLIRKPNINWMGKRVLFFVISTVLITGGMFAFFTRSDVENSKYDIEFTGGTSAQIELKEGTGYDRQKVEDEIRRVGREEFNNPALAVARVYSVGDTELQYEITTTETNKTTATVNFPQAGETVESVTEAIEKAAEESAGTLYNLTVTRRDDERSFSVATRQVNKALVREVLEKAFGDKATVSEPQVDEIVNRAIREAFGNLLVVRQDLGLEIVSTAEVTESTVELADFLGGVQFECNLEKEATYSELETRFKDIRFKPDMRDLVWIYRYQILRSDFSEFEPDELVSNFVFVSAHPEAGYRKLSDEEWRQFVENEKTKIDRAVSLEASLARVTQIDPSIGEQAKTQALIAIILSLVAIVGYISFRFGTAKYGFAAIAALVHDVCITLGAVTVCTYIAGTPIGKALLIEDFKINLQTIAAFLTIIGYSLNDTIVVFDRIRENRGKLATLNPQIISNSINQTLSRTLLTSFTTFMVVLIMFIWGGVGLRGFTFALLVGILIGTYSSIAIAAPILLLGTKAPGKERRK